MLFYMEKKSSLPLHSLCDFKETFYEALDIIRILIFVLHLDRLSKNRFKKINEPSVVFIPLRADVHRHD